MDEMTFMEFIQEISKAILAMPYNIATLYTQPKTFVGWMLTCMITVFLLSGVIGIIITILSPLKW